MHDEAVDKSAQGKNSRGPMMSITALAPRDRLAPLSERSAAPWDGPRHNDDVASSLFSSRYRNATAARALYPDARVDARLVYARLPFD